MRCLRSKDFITGVLFTVLGLSFMWLSQEHELGTAARMGPAYFPTLLGGLLALLGVVIALIATFAPAPADIDTIEPFYWKGLLAVLGAVALFAVLLLSCGLMIAVASLIVVARLGIKDDHRPRKTRWLETLILIVLLDALTYTIFIQGVGLIVTVWPSF